MCFYRIDNKLGISNYLTSLKCRLVIIVFGPTKYQVNLIAFKGIFFTFVLHSSSSLSILVLSNEDRIVSILKYDAIIM